MKELGFVLVLLKKTEKTDSNHKNRFVVFYENSEKSLVNVYNTFLIKNCNPKKIFVN